jgi:hypothetical protein
MADCSACWCLSPVEFPLELSLHCHRITGLVKCFDNKRMLLHTIWILAQWHCLLSCKLLTFPHTMVPSLTFPLSFHNGKHLNYCMFFWISCIIYKTIIMRQINGMGRQSCFPTHVIFQQVEHPHLSKVQRFCELVLGEFNFLICNVRTCKYEPKKEGNKS